MDPCEAWRKWMGVSLLGLATGVLAADLQTVDLRIVARKAEGGVRTVSVPKGATVALRVQVDEEMDIHVHGYELQQRVKPGRQATLIISSQYAGRFPVTGHLPQSSSGGHAREPAFLYLEVQPE